MSAVSLLRTAGAAPEEGGPATVRWRLGERGFPGTEGRENLRCNQFASSCVDAPGFPYAPGLEINR